MREIACFRIGAVARDILRHAIDGEAQVLAAFERSFYVQTEHGLVCIGADGIGNGPINVVCTSDGWPRDVEGAGIFPEAKCVITADVVRVGEDVRFAFAAAEEWSPPVWLLPVDGWAEALADLRRLMERDAPREGLARSVLGTDGGTTAVARAASAPLRVVRGELPGCLKVRVRQGALTDAMTLLIGLGPGLTPSGDDVIGGMMLALTAVQQRALRDQIWAVIGPELEMLTVPVSAMHLALAADGLAAEALHEVVGAVLAGDTVRLHGAVARAGAIGATSGWDGMAGVLLVLEASRDLASGD